MRKIMYSPSPSVLEVVVRGHFNVEFKWALQGMKLSGMIFSQMVISEVATMQLRVLH